MWNITVMTARSILLLATIFSVAIVLPMIFAFESVLMFPLLAAAVFAYIIGLVWQVRWFMDKV